MALIEYHSVVNQLFEKYDFLAMPSAQVFPFDANNKFSKKNWFTFG